MKKTVRRENHDIHQNGNYLVSLWRIAFLIRAVHNHTGICSHSIEQNNDPTCRFSYQWVYFTTYSLSTQQISNKNAQLSPGVCEAWLNRATWVVLAFTLNPRLSIAAQHPIAVTRYSDPDTGNLQRSCRPWDERQCILAGLLLDQLEPLECAQISQCTCPSRSTEKRLCLPQLSLRRKRVEYRSRLYFDVESLPIIHQDRVYPG